MKVNRPWLSLAISLVFGLPVVVGLVLTLTRPGESQPQAPEARVTWPAPLSGLPATVTDLAVDDSGTVWFPVLKPPDGSAGQTNLLYRYDQGNGSLETFPLPPEEVSAFVGRIEPGQGAREGKILVAWQSTLLEVDSKTGRVTPLEVPLDRAKIVTGPEPPTTRIYDLAVDQEGTVWVSRDHYPYLIAVYPDGSSKQFQLPEEAGSPEWLAVDSEGRIWATLIRHRRVLVGPNRLSVNAYRFTLRFDPETAQADVLPVASYNIAGAGGMVVAMVGDQPGGVQRLDTKNSNPVTLTHFGPTMLGDVLAASLGDDVWYSSRSIAGIVNVDRDGAVRAVALPKRKAALDNRLGGNCISTNGESANCSDQPPTGSITPVLAIAVAPDGSAWFSTGDRIGHAIP